ncbi:MAG: magnesium/cobalt transporter CorA [Candidatus Riflemargulisbacteria bacterium]
MYKKLKITRKKKIGSIPGTLLYTGEKVSAPVKVSLITYNSKDFDEGDITSFDHKKINNKDLVSWININGLHDTEVINKLNTIFPVHPLVLEDVLHVNQRPKMEDFKEYLFVVLKMFQYDVEKEVIKSEQVSFILYPNTLITFQEEAGNFFDGVREHLRRDKGKIRALNADYLMYALIDAIVDNYYLILEQLAEKIELLETEVFANPNKITLKRIHYLKQEIIMLRKSVWPLRDVTSLLYKDETDLVCSDTRFFFRDLYDHTIEVMDIVETYRDLTSALMEMYLSSISNKMNEIMKVLTMISTIFIPLSFFAGVYGMNFKHMPELELVHAYPLVLSFMATIAIVMLIFFKRMKWL